MIAAIRRMIGCTEFGISVRRGPASVGQSVTVLPASARDRLAEEMGTAEQMASLLAAVARVVVQEPPIDGGGYGGSIAT
jgi:hypothetical protein